MVRGNYPRRYGCLLALALCLLTLMPPSALWAAPIPSRIMKLDCKPTPEVPGASASYPGRERIVHSSKLARPAGKARYANGEVIMFTGIVYDRDCVPVSNAAIELWQTDTTGSYRYSDAGELLSPDPGFAGSGKAFTNNLGEFQFLTVYPGAYADRAPHVHLRVTHEEFPTLYTEIFFDGDFRNEKDSKLRAFKGDLKPRVLARVIPLPSRDDPAVSFQAHIDLVLSGKVKFTQY